MQVYKVGGNVRDKLIGRKSRDIDYVVVGETPEAMLKLGYRQVGADFPVFIHPATHDEYALARTERKSAKGHKGFVTKFDPSVTLEEDLARRDFRVNAMAVDTDGNLIDPYNGRYDVSKRLLHHVSDAFIEDPLRVLRAARLAAELGFVIATETLELMKQIVKNGELSHLSTERVWSELQRGLASPNPAEMFFVLKDCGALKVLLPEADELFFVSQKTKMQPSGNAGMYSMRVITNIQVNCWDAIVCWAGLLHNVGSIEPSSAQYKQAEIDFVKNDAVTVQKICKRFKVSKNFERTAVAIRLVHKEIDNFANLTAEQIVEMFGRISAWRDPLIVEQLLAVCDSIHCSIAEVKSAYEVHPNHDLVKNCYKAAMDIKVSEEDLKKSKDPKQEVETLRIQKVEQVLKS